MLVLVTDDGRIRNRVFRNNRSFDEETENCFKDLISKRIQSKKVSELNKAYMQTVIAEAGIYALELMPILTAVFETASEIHDANLKICGQNYLYNICPDEITAMKILSLVNQKDPFISILKTVDEKSGVIFGADTGYKELNSTTLIAAKFNCDKKYKGYLGVIGPNRMSYEQIIPCIEYTADVLTKIMIEAQNDMED